jgi:IS605 OrfB family transposase
MLTITAKLEIKDQEILDGVCRRWSSCKRYAFNRLLESTPINRKEFENKLKSLFGLNIRYVRDAVEEAKSLITSQIELKNDPKKVIFGSKKLFFKLKKRHLLKDQRKKLKLNYQETRKYNLYSRGEANQKGNVNLRIVGDKLRINIGNYKWIYATIHSTHKKLPLLLASKCYTVKLHRKDNQYYVNFSIEESFPEIKISVINGTIGIDLNAFPSNIAWAEIDKQGNYLESGTIGTPYLYDCSSNKRDYYAWKHAHEITNLALIKGKAIIIENLKNLKGFNRALSNFCYNKLKKAIIACAKRKGIEIIQVHPAYTSVIGCLKYAPLYNLSRHTAAAIVIARRGLGLKEELPKNYKRFKIFASQVKVTKVTLRKKELGTTQKLFGRIYKVCKKAVLTERSTGLNWSIFKKFLLSGDYSRIPKLAPLLDYGAYLKGNSNLVPRNIEANQFRTS